MESNTGQDFWEDQGRGKVLRLVSKQRLGALTGGGGYCSRIGADAGWRGPEKEGTKMRGCF